MIRPNARIALLAAVAAITWKAAAIDWSIGGGIVASYSIDLSGGRSDSASVRAEPTLSLAASSWEALLSVSLSGLTDPGTAEYAIADAYFRTWLGDYFVVTAGWTSPAGLAAEVFPLTAFLGPSDPLSRLSSGGGSASRKSEPSIQLKAASDWWRASIECAPFEPELVLPNVDSPWFPSEFVPASFTFGGDTFSLLGFAYPSGVESGASLSPSYIARIGASLGPAEIDIAYFHGLERQAVFSGAISYNDLASLDHTYHAYLVPHRGVVDSLALAATAVGEAWRFWSELSLTSGASLSTGSVDVTDQTIFFGYFRLGSPNPWTDIPPCVSRDEFACTAGASWTPELGSSVGLVAMAEATWSQFIDPPEGSPVPTLARAAAASIEFSRLAGRIGVTMSGIVSLADWSAALRPSASVDLGAERKVELSTLVFLGDSDSDLGAYSGRRYLMLSFSQNY
jgi:hypothetical protein